MAHTTNFETITVWREDFTLASGRYVSYCDASVTLEIDSWTKCWDYPDGQTITVSEITGVSADHMKLTQTEVAELVSWWEAQEYTEDDLEKVSNPLN